MIKRIIPMLLASMLLAPALAQTEPAANVVPITSESTENAPETILVVGQRPGPGLWKVSKGDNVMWVFGTYSPLPKQLTWRSQQVEVIVAQSQEYLLPPSAEPKLSVFKMVTLLPLAIGYAKLPDGAELKDVLPVDVYARWLPLKAKYIGADAGVERERPLFAAWELYSKALAKSGFAKSFELNNAILKIAKDNKVKITSTKIDIVVDDPGRVLKDFKKSKLEDVECFSRTLERLETDIDAMRVRANAWAKGDLNVIKSMSFADRDGACDAALASSAVFKGRPEFEAVEARLQDAWMAAAEKALATNRSTFARLPLKNILDPKGYLAALSAKGYTVESPE